MHIYGKTRIVREIIEGRIVIEFVLNQVCVNIPICYV